VSRIRIAPIVEGHGESYCIRDLLTRTWSEVLGGDYAEVLQPIRRHRHQVVKREHLAKAIELAALKLRASPSDDPALILVLLDADEDAACILGPDLQRMSTEIHGDLDITCVLATVEFETWFVGAAESLADFLELAEGELLPADPEGARLGKGWIDAHFRGSKYSETADQPRLVARMDLHACRIACPSFDKLCRELEKRRHAT
jgi:hypothetical protein